jgi:GR25 family glycosyltransferase involved in LPS biosynthesis
MWLLASVLCLHAIANADTGCLENRVGYVGIISLTSRPDRLRNVQQQLQMMGLHRWEVIPAIAHPCGGLGCSLSHILATERCAQSGHQLCLIVEDDFELVGNFTTQMEEMICKGLNVSSEWDVLLPSSNVLLFEKSPKYSYVRRVLNAQTTSSYIVHSLYSHTLRHRFTQGAAALNAYKCKTRSEHSIDIHWKSLQRIDRWFVFEPRIGRQAPSYSDIEKRNVAYGVR